MKLPVIDKQKGAKAMALRIYGIYMEFIEILAILARTFGIK